MKASLAILTAFLLLASRATAQPAPSGPPPVFKVVHGADKAKGQIIFLETVTKTLPVQKQIEVIMNGVKVKQLVTELVLVQETRTTAVDAAKSRVITPDGKQLPIDEVWKRLKQNTVVVISGDGNTPAQAYLRALNPETLVVIAPQMDRIVAPPVVVPPPPPKN
jgi:hypothetical protein